MRKLSNVEKEKRTSLDEITRSCRCIDQRCTEAPENRQEWTWIQMDTVFYGTSPFSNVI